MKIWRVILVIALLILWAVAMCFGIKHLLDQDSVIWMM